MKMFLIYLFRLIFNPFDIVGQMPNCYVSTLKQTKFGQYFLVSLVWFTMPFDFIWHLITGIIIGIPALTFFIIGNLCVWLNDIMYYYFNYKLRCGWKGISEYIWLSRSILNRNFK